jgi:PAS domain S-box-containing protein
MKTIHGGGDASPGGKAEAPHESIQPLPSKSGLEVDSHLKNMFVSVSQMSLANLVIVDFGTPSRTISYAAPGIEKLLGYAPADIVSKNFLFFMQGPAGGVQNNPAIQNRIQQSLRLEKVIMEEVICFQKDGTAILCLMYALPILDSDSRAVYYFAVFSDITPRKGTVASH